MLATLLSELTRQGYLSGDTDVRRLHRAYRGRAYHNLAHLEEMLQVLDRHPLQPQEPIAFYLALLYHDIVYRPGRRDNEERSARVAQRQMIHYDHPEGRQQRVRQLILCTQHHRPTAGDDGDEALLIDLDMAVLARSESGYDRYAAAVRREFWYFPGRVYRKGRLMALRHFLAEPTIYHTDFGRSELEAAARKNIRREIDSLASR